jgi:hypothetical protein
LPSAARQPPVGQGRPAGAVRDGAFVQLQLFLDRGKGGACRRDLAVEVSHRSFEFVTALCQRLGAGGFLPAGRFHFASHSPGIGAQPIGQKLQLGGVTTPVLAFPALQAQKILKHAHRQLRPRSGPIVEPRRERPPPQLSGSIPDAVVLSLRYG